MCLFGTSIARYKEILVECNRTHFYSAFEIGAFCFIDLLRSVAFLIFIWDAYCMGYFKRKGLTLPCSNKEKCLSGILIVTCTLVVLLGLAIYAASVALSLERDHMYIDACDSSRSLSVARLVNHVHTAAKALVYFPVFVVSCCAAEILYSSVRKWKNGFPDIANEWHYKIRKSTPQDNPAAGNSGDCDDNRNKISDLVRKKFRNLYSKYIEVGKDALQEQKAVQRWFALIYFIYLVFILVQIGHLFSLRGRVKNRFDTANACLNILFHFFAFLIPYFVANWVNVAHLKFHRK